MLQPRIYITQPIPEQAVARLLDVGDVRVGPPGGIGDAEALADAVAGAQAILCFVNDPVDAIVLDAMTGDHRVVATMGVGFDNIDVKEATRRGIRVTHAPDVLTDATADLTFALILAVCRRLDDGQAVARAGGWQGITAIDTYGTDVSGKTLGIVGAGRIGTAVGRRAVGFDMTLMYVSPRHNHDLDQRGGVRCDLQALLRVSDIVTLHVPLLPKTRHLINDETLGLFKPGAYLINTSRGAVVDEQALISALDRGQLAGAGLDVFEHEPRIPQTLLNRPNVICLPHIASATAETRLRMAMLAVDNLVATLAGEQPPTPVNGHRIHP